MAKIGPMEQQLREMRERRHAERSRPLPEPKKPPKTELQREVDEIIDPPKPKEDLKPARPPKHVATKSRKRVAEAVGKVRDNKLQLSAWIDAALYREIKIAIAEDGTKHEAWVEHALREFLEARKP